MTQEKNNVVGIGHNSNDNKLTETLLKVSKTLDEVWSNLSDNYFKYSAVNGDTYNFAPFPEEYEVRKGSSFERNQLHFEAQREQSKCMKQIHDVRELIKEVVNAKKN